MAAENLEVGCKERQAVAGGRFIQKSRLAKNKPAF
jgi:hypothetical protein